MGWDNYVLLTDEVTEVLWGYMPVPPLCGPQFLPLGLRSFSVLTVDASIIYLSKFIQLFRNKVKTRTIVLGVLDQ